MGRSRDAPPEQPAEPLAGTGAYTMGVASRLTGIDADTLRVWERRYGFPRPARTPGGSRLYSAADIAKLQLVVRALALGHRPGQIVSRTMDELERLVEEAPPASESSPPPSLVEGILALLRREEAAALTAELRRAALLLGPRRFVVELAHPLAVQTGALWEAGAIEVHHEHLMTHALSTQLRLLTSLFDEQRPAAIALLATLPDEAHGLGLEMVALHLATLGVTPRVLGVGTPPDQIVRAARAHDAAVVGISVLFSSDRVAVTGHVRWILGELPGRVQVWIGGGGAAGLALSDTRVRLIDSPPALEEAVASLLSTRR